MIDFGSFFADYGGETADEVQQRTVNTLQEILNETNKHNVVVVSHGDVLSLFTHTCLPLAEASEMKFTNCCILKFDYEDGAFTLNQYIIRHKQRKARLTRIEKLGISAYSIQSTTANITFIV